MNIRKVVALALIFILTVVFGYFTFAGAAWGIYEIRPLYEQIPKGLDINGGISIVYEAKDSTDPELDQKMEAVYNVLRKRLDLKGFDDASVVRDENGEIVVNIPIGLKDKDVSSLVGYLGARSFLEFKDPDGNVIFTSADMNRVFVQPSPTDTTQTGDKYLVGFQLNAAATEKFKEVTTAYADSDKQMTVTIDGTTIASPAINAPILTGSAFVPTGELPHETAVMLSQQLKSGSHPVELNTISTTALSAYYGESAVSQLGFAILAGMLLMFAVFIIYYRLSGLVGVLSMSIYGLITLFFLAVIPGVRLSLASFAGLLLAIGFTADAHISLFELLYEEINSGKSLRLALKLCFKRMLSAIWRPNFFILLVAFVLMFVSKGTLKSFSTVLFIGDLIGVLTAVLIHYGLMNLVLGFQLKGKALFYPLRARRNRETA